MTVTAAPQTDWLYPEVTEGSIFVSSWGYDQTNVDYYRVVRRTKATVWVQEVHAAIVSGRGGPQENVVPSTEPKVGAWVRTDAGTVYDPAAPASIRKHRLSRAGWSRPTFTVNSFAYASLWDGTPEYRTGTGWGR